MFILLLLKTLSGRGVMVRKKFPLMIYLRIFFLFCEMTFSHTFAKMLLLRSAKIHPKFEKNMTHTQSLFLGNWFVFKGRGRLKLVTILLYNFPPIKPALDVSFIKMFLF